MAAMGYTFTWEACRRSRSYWGAYNRTGRFVFYQKLIGFLILQSNSTGPAAESSSSSHYSAALGRTRPLDALRASQVKVRPLGSRNESFGPISSLEIRHSGNSLPGSAQSIIKGINRHLYTHYFIAVKRMFILMAFQCKKTFYCSHATWERTFF